MQRHRCWLSHPGIQAFSVIQVHAKVLDIHLYGVQREDSSIRTRLETLRLVDPGVMICRQFCEHHVFTMILQSGSTIRFTA